MKEQAIPSSSRGELQELVGNALHHLENLGYRPETLAQYQRTWKAFLRFASKDSEEQGMSGALARRFLEFREIPVEQRRTGLPSLHRHVRAAMRVLTEFSLHGHFRCRRAGTPEIKLPSTMETVLCGYQRFCREYLHNGPRTIRVRTQSAREFLHYLNTRAVGSVGEIRPSMLTEFLISKGHLKTTTVATLVANLRSLLRYLCMEGLVCGELIERLPKVRVQQDQRIPSVWRHDDVTALLAAVDRTSACGKRDYSILLLAARLGMRVGDIRALRLEHLWWGEARIEIIQTKTGTPLSLPLTEEIGNALIDYLRNARRRTQHRQVFLRANAPFEPFSQDSNLHYIITTYCNRAGIVLPAQNRCGLHSLRHTVASRLLEVETPMATISGLMGHLSVEATRIYTKIDVEALRSVALDPEEVGHA